LEKLAATLIVDFSGIEFVSSALKRVKAANGSWGFTFSIA
jgi:hypothetical protein